MLGGLAATAAARRPVVRGLTSGTKVPPTVPPASSARAALADPLLRDAGSGADAGVSGTPPLLPAAAAAPGSALGTGAMVAAAALGVCAVVAAAAAAVAAAPPPSAPHSTWIGVGALRLMPTGRRPPAGSSRS
eukprot:243690-Chlamydomonas_euryale.AAC.1